VLGVLLQKADILIRECTILPMTGKDIIENGAIAIKDQNIIFVGKQTSAASIKAETTIIAKGKVAMPGLINCHTHVPMTLFRGVAEDQPLNVWLKKTIWPLEAKLRPEDVYDGALLGCLEMIKSGTTCFGDMYFHEKMVAKAVEESGLRAVLAEGIFGVGGKSEGEKMLRQGVGFVEQFCGSADGRVGVMLGPHAAYSCSPELLRKVSEEASRLGVGMCIHLAESRGLFAEFEKEYGVGEVGFLDGLGFLNDRVVAAHCIDLSDKDMSVLSKRRMNVAYCPVANLKLGLGVAKAKSLADLGVNVGFGTDGPASNNCLDMFETMKIGALVQKNACGDPSVFGALDVLRMATVNGARALGVGDRVGLLEVEKKADVILVDFRKPHLTPLHNVYANLVYSARGSDVDTVIVDGKILMENGQVKTLNERAVLEKAEKTAADLTSC
jgi:5-methylthioadenosine/S-adenosylhomocysteine deaminase